MNVVLFIFTLWLWISEIQRMIKMHKKWRVKMKQRKVVKRSVLG